MRGLGTSLNVSVAVGVILLEAERQRRAAGFYEACRLAPAERERTLFEWSLSRDRRALPCARPRVPELTADGMMASNPLLEVSTA